MLTWVAVSMTVSIDSIAINVCEDTFLPMLPCFFLSFEHVSPAQQQASVSSLLLLAFDGNCISSMRKLLVMSSYHLMLMFTFADVLDAKMRSSLCWWPVPQRRTFGILPSVDLLPMFCHCKN